MTIRQRWTMVAAILGSGIVFLDGTVVNVALKKIGEDLPASIVGVLEGQTFALDELNDFAVAEVDRGNEH